MSFQGWQESALDFFEGLERENTKAYWTAHRSVYDHAVLEPMTQLTDELTATKYRTEPVSGCLILQPKDEVHAALGAARMPLMPCVSRSRSISRMRGCSTCTGR